MRIMLDRVAPEALRSVVADSLPSWATFVDLARSDPQFGSELHRADVLLHVLDPVSADDIETASALRLIQKFGTGVNTIDLAAARANNVQVTNMPGANAPAVAELTLGLMLAGLRDLPALHNATLAGIAWPGQPEAPAPAAELGGRQVGLVGYGAIAQRVATAAAALGAHVVHHSRRTDRPGWLPLDELLRTSDVISLHLPLDDDTVELLDRTRLSMLRHDALLVNTSRGGLVDHEALLELLENGQLRRACLDVFHLEPLPATDDLLRTRRLIATPHIGWYTEETLERCWHRALDNCERLRDGRPLTDLVA